MSNKVKSGIILRIDNSGQSAVCGILLSSVAIDCTLAYYILNER